MRALILLLVLASGCGSAEPSRRQDASMPGDAGATADAHPAPGDGGMPGDGGATDDGGTPAMRLPIVHGDYAGFLHTSSGALDVETTAARLAEAHVDLYAYLIYRDPQTEWDTLPAFLTAAAARGIDVWVYLVPPTEVPGGGTCTGDYPPYQLDYVEWARQIAMLSLAHPNLTGFAIDDFGYNTPLDAHAACPLFSPSYVHEMTTAAHAVAPGLGFYPVLYWPNLEGQDAVVQPLRGDVTGVVFPFRDGTNANTYVTSTAEPEIQLLGASLSCRRDYQAATTRARSACFQVSFPWHTASSAGTAAGASQTIRVGTGPQSLTFYWQHDFAGTTSGYVYAQVLVDGSPVWETDIGTVSRFTWRQETVSLDAALAGKTTATLELRVVHQQGVSNFGQRVWFDSLSPTGFTLDNGDFEAGDTGWTIDTSGAFTAMPVRTASLITMVYAATLSSDPDHPPTASYVGTVLDVGLSLSDEGYADGTMTYLLDKSVPDTSIYTRVQATY